MTVQMFFDTRSSARAAGFGKMTDNGTQSSNRWARTLEIEVTKTKTVSTARGVRKNGYKAVSVVVKKAKTLVH